MRVKSASEPRHIHRWELYVPEIDIELSTYLGVTIEQSQWVYRRCDCKTKMRCQAAVLTGYAKSYVAYADEEWEAVD
jgi:hypothetical protein